MATGIPARARDAGEDGVGGSRLAAACRPSVLAAATTAAGRRFLGVAPAGAAARPSRAGGRIVPAAVIRFGICGWPLCERPAGRRAARQSSRSRPGARAIEQPRATAGSLGAFPAVAA